MNNFFNGQKASIQDYATLGDLLPPAPAYLKAPAKIWSSRPAPISIENVELKEQPIVALLIANSSRKKIENTLVSNFSKSFSGAGLDDGEGQQIIAYGDNSEISGYLDYRGNLLILASRGYRGTSLAGLTVDIDGDPNTENRLRQLFWFPHSYSGSEPLAFENLHLLVIFASSTYPDGLRFMQANERIARRSAIGRLSPKSYQIINVQGSITVYS